MHHSPILVAGGAGYIGSHVCYLLKKRGYTPVVLDDLSRGHKEAVKFGPLIHGNIGDANLVNEACAQYKPVAALHFAALIEVSESVRFPELFMHNNWDMARQFIENLQKNGVVNLVFSSTAAVYGTPNEVGPIKENSPLKPINPYGESKLKTENFLRSQPHMRSVVLRYFNAAGALPEEELGEAHWPETHLIPNALLTILGLKNDPFKIFGQDYPTIDGTAVRDYIHIMDLAEAHVLALEYLLHGKESTVLNLGTSTGTSVKAIVDMIEIVTGRHLPHTYASRRTGDPPFLVADNGKAKDILGWMPKLGLDRIISSAYHWHSSRTYKNLIEKRGISSINPY